MLSARTHHSEQGGTVMTRTQVHSTTTEAGTPTDGESRPLDYPTGTRSPGRLPNRPTIVAVGPFDDIAHAEQLAAAFTVVRRVYEAQLALIGGGAERDAIVRRAAAHGVETDVHLIADSSGPGWPDLLAAADLVVPSTTTSTTTIREVLAAGRAVVAPEHPCHRGARCTHQRGPDLPARRRVRDGRGDVAAPHHTRTTGKHGRTRP
ncbi:glycosyltransferase [Rhodococcus sp. NM-2]|uniref:glycosyltransferase n=1 Tax=Rhodococcus sp. NM-2 TaxID=3401174 RepID=UPI003AAA67C6